MNQSRLRNIREAKAKLLRSERDGQRAAAACIALAFAAVLLMVVFAPWWGV